MIKYQNDCVGCPDGVPCMGRACPYRHVPHFYCDECGDEADELREFDDGRQLCNSCLLAQFPPVEIGESEL